MAAGALLVALTVGCGAASSLPASQSYFPLELGSHWVYDTSFYGPNGNTTTTEVAICRIRGSDQFGRMYLVSTCAGDELVEAQFLYEHGPEIAQPLLVNRTGDPRPRDPPEVIARLDMHVGQQWRWAGTIDDEEERTLYRVTNRGRVITPAGEFDALRLLIADQSGGPPAVVERWYAPGVGLVKEAGVALFPGEGDQLQPVELVRLLREHNVLPVDSIGCCQKVPTG